MAGSQERDAMLGPMFKESGSGEDEYLTNNNQVLWYAPTEKKKHFTDTGDADTGVVVPGP